MNEGNFFSLLATACSSNVWWSQRKSHRANFGPNAQVGSQDSQIAGWLPGAKPYRTFVLVDDIAQVSQNPTLAPDGKKVKFDQRLCGDAMVAHLKREIPEITATRWVRQFSINMEKKYQLVVLDRCFWSSSNRMFLCCEFFRDSTADQWEGCASKIKSISSHLLHLTKLKTFILR